MIGCCAACRPKSLGEWGSMGAVPLLSGDAGTRQTVSLMYKLIDDAVKNPAVNRFAIDTIRAAPQYDHTAEAFAIYETVLANFRFVNDPVGPDGAKETLRPVVDILAIGAGDCDDFTMLISSLLGTIGIESHIVTVAADPADPESFSHVYPEALLDGQWVALDAARPGAEFGLAPSHYFRKKVWPSGNETPGPLGQMRRQSLSGYITLRGLGDDATDIASLITAAGQSAANIELASNAAPQNIYGTVTTNPNTGLTSPLVSTAYAGYPYATPPGQVAISSSALPWIIMFGLAAVLWIKK